MKFCLVVSEELRWQAASEVYLWKFLVQRGITPTKLRRSKYPCNMHNYIWCPYYLPSFMKFCSVVSEELRWQTVWRTDEQDKNNMSPHKSGGDIIKITTCKRVKYWYTWKILKALIVTMYSNQLQSLKNRHLSQSSYLYYQLCIFVWIVKTHL